MINGLMAAASGMEAEQTQLNAVANDLANVDTTGYQSERVGFDDLLYTSSGAGNGSTQATGDGAAAGIVGRNQAQGALQQTGRSLDVAIVGQGFLEVRRPDGTIGLTRNGALQLNANRQLADQQGDMLVPPITVPAGQSVDSVGISRDGTVQSGGRTLGRLSLVTVPAPDQLLAAGNSQYTVTAASGAVRATTGATIQQGALEGANVDMSQAMSAMIDAQRSYEMDSRAIQMQDQMLQIANQIKK